MGSSRRSRRRKFRLIAVFACVVAGLFSTLVVTAFCALRSQERPRELRRSDFTIATSTNPQTLVVRDLRQWGATRRVWFVLEPMASLEQWQGSVKGILYWIDLDTGRADTLWGSPKPLINGPVTVPIWGGAARAYQSNRWNDPFGSECAFGWPMRAFWCEFKTDAHPFFCWDEATECRGGLVLKSGYGRLSYPTYLPDTRVIPLRPIWTGLAVNSAIFAAGWWLIVLVFIHIRRRTSAHARIMKGLCPKCAYDLRGDFPSGCPECGWNRSPSHASN